MREIRTSGSMSGDGKRAGALSVNAPIFDSTEGRIPGPLKTRKNAERVQVQGFCRLAFFRVLRAFCRKSFPALPGILHPFADCVHE